MVVCCYLTCTSSLFIEDIENDVIINELVQRYGISEEVDITDVYNAINTILNGVEGAGVDTLLNLIATIYGNSNCEIQVCINYVNSNFGHHSETSEALVTIFQFHHEHSVQLPGIRTSLYRGAGYYKERDGDGDGDGDDDNGDDDGSADAGDNEAHI